MREPNITAMYSRICKGKIYSYSVCDRGFVIKTTNKTFSENRVTPFLKRGHAMVKINNKEYKLKKIVAEHFIGAKTGDVIKTMDSNPFNCAIENLKIMSAKQHGKETGGLSRSKAVEAAGVRYTSVRSCAKDLYVSYQTLSDYLNGKSKYSVLSGLNVKYVE